MSKRGRPTKKYNPDHAKQAQAMSQYGVPQEDIAATIGVCVETMQKLYGGELRKGKASANTNVGKRLYSKCMGGDTTALIFWAKTQMGWKETQRLEHSGKDGAPIQVADLSKMSDTQLQEILGGKSHDAE